MTDSMLPPPPPPPPGPDASAAIAQRPWWKKKWVIAVGALVIVGAIAGSGDSEDADLQTASLETPMVREPAAVSTTAAPTTTEVVPTTTTEPPTTTTAPPTTLAPPTTTTTTPPPPTTAPAPTAPPTTAAPLQSAAPAAADDCTPGYSPCLPPASDYDCSGGSGNGPAYTGTVSVDHSFGDPYDLDRDGDGVGCD